MATRAEWIERVKRWKRSGLSAAEFARREGLKAKQLHWWNWKLGASDTVPQPEEPRFLPVRVVSSPTPAPTPSTSAALVMTSPSSPAATAIEIALPNGRLVRVPPGFDPATLECVLAIAAEGGAC
jgi:transposase